MIIRNKFNGYGFDGSRLCHDPVSLSIAATQAGAASSAAATAAAAQAATTAAGTAAAQAAAAEAAKTAGLEAAKQSAIQTGTQQMTQQAAQEAAKQAAQQAAQQGIAQAGTQATQQAGVEAAKQGIFSANPAGMPPTAGAPITPAGPATPLPPAGGAPTPMTLEQQLAQIQANPTDLSKFPRYEQVASGPGGQTPLVEKTAEAATFDPSKSLAFKSNVPPAGQENLYAFKEAVPNFNAAQPTNYKAAPYLQPKIGTEVGADTFANVAKEQAGINQLIQPQAIPPNPNSFPLAPKNPLQQGFETGLQYVKDNPITSGMGLMSAGQYMNKPEEEDKDKYKNTVDMSEFQPSIPTQRPFTRSYEYQQYAAKGGLMGYAVGGPVEQMAAMNAVGANTGYPMAALQTPMYANPAMQRPEATNVLAPSADAGVTSYSGEPRFADGGLSEEARREYGLSTKAQRAARNLTKSYEEMEAERQKEAMKLFGERTDPGIVPRSRTQMMNSPFSAAIAEHARLGKKAKVPTVQLPKTNLGDIDTYMDIPIEAASGGIMHGLGGYSDGGRLLKGPGDGVSDSIPAVIGKRQPARLADGEFVIPARIVSELGNGSTEAGARKLYAMMERVQKARRKSVGKDKVAVNSKADKHLPA